MKIKIARAMKYGERMDKKLNVIWTVSKMCAWNCGICCVDAYHVKSNGEGMSIRHSNLEEEIMIQKSPDKYEAISKALIARGLELSLEKKLQVLENLRPFNIHVDFSGGDPLLNKDNITLIRKASDYFGRHDISVTTTSAGLAKIKPEELAPYIGQLEFTYDNVTDNDKNRPLGYNSSNLAKIQNYSAKEVKLKAQAPLTVTNTSKETIKQIYEDLHNAGVDRLLLMRTFPVGRGDNRNFQELTKEGYLNAIAEYRKLETQYKYPEVKLQCALKGLSSPSDNPCDLVKQSIGITYDGIALASPWAYNRKGDILDPIFILGDLKKDNIADIYGSDEVKNIFQRADENSGHCKMFCYLNNGSKGFESLFMKNDYLFK